MTLRRAKGQHVLSKIFNNEDKGWALLLSIGSNQHLDASWVWWLSKCSSNLKRKYIQIYSWTICIILNAFFLPPQREGPHKKAMIQFLESKMKIVISLVTFSTVLLILWSWCRQAVILFCRLNYTKITRLVQELINSRRDRRRGDEFATFFSVQEAISLSWQLK